MLLRDMIGLIQAQTDIINLQTKHNQLSVWDNDRLRTNKQLIDEQLSVLLPEPNTDAEEHF